MNYSSNKLISPFLKSKSLIKKKSRSLLSTPTPQKNRFIIYLLIGIKKEVAIYHSASHRVQLCYWLFHLNRISLLKPFSPVCQTNAQTLNQITVSTEHLSPQKCSINQSTVKLLPHIISTCELIPSGKKLL